MKAKFKILEDGRKIYWLREHYYPGSVNGINVFNEEINYYFLRRGRFITTKNPLISKRHQNGSTDPFLRMAKKRKKYFIHLASLRTRYNREIEVSRDMGEIMVEDFL